MLQKLVFSLIILGSFLFLSSCKDDTSFVVKLHPVTNLVASTVAMDTVQLKWEKSANEGRGDFAGYLINVMRPDGSTEKDTTIIKGKVSIKIANLQQDIIYTYKVTSKASVYSENAVDSDPVSIKWKLAWIRLSPVTNLKAFSVDTASVGLTWKISDDESKPDFTNYLIKVKKPGNVPFKELLFQKGKDSVIVSQLNNGVTYTFEVISKSLTLPVDYIDSEPTTIKWATAWRFETEDSKPIKLYETSTTDGASGLIFYYLQTKTSKTVLLNSRDSAFIDVYLRTETDSRVSIRSFSLYRAGKRVTKFSTINRDAETLNDPNTAPTDTNTYTLSEVMIDSVQVPSSKIYFYKGHSRNYGRLLVMRNPSNGTLLWGTSPEQYLRLMISYQSTVDNPYSKQTR